ncbi:MAG: 3'(2'),5'-bisphosphate nucleotidase CysQ [Alphaproteobacteria bacterium]|jgi:3'(2'), 5'-bisphosphate nucleotidase|nr:3'(2'),5'-bisphosphate nucleotidase CysQ [Alphaproteobacteria bacterium]MBN9558449.1 3'(2'),5'-bisphosphate nucleotidase CysQ [Alphaproteobacteria bacterium]MBN9569966.1 3'(2'),5'-bisphosphate nucleotidase CysQ [Alphaproteobacteria bacterium]
MTQTTTPAAMPDFATALGEIAFEAGKIILGHYGEDHTPVRRKEDHSPVTAADEEAEAHILRALSRLEPGAAVIAEEEVAAGRIAKIGARFFLVDPLDGTKEFLNRNGEFTVNIAEIRDGVPVSGVVYAPACNRLFIGDAEAGAFEIATDGGVYAPQKARAIAARAPAADGLVAVASRSHRDYKTEEWLASYKVKNFLSAGSSLKFCLVASGEADIYPRLGRTMEWDTAAGHAVLAAAGGSVCDLDGKALSYGKTEAGFANPFFVARGRI